jgi:hypothetical protein
LQPGTYSLNFLSYGSSFDSNLKNNSGNILITAILGGPAVAQFALLSGTEFFFAQGGGTKLFVVGTPNSTLKVFLDSGGGVVNAQLNGCFLTLTKLQ